MTVDQAFEIWGEVERMRQETGDYTLVPDRPEWRTAIRRWHARISRPDCAPLLVHHDVDAWLIQQGRFARDLALMLWRDGWEWSESPAGTEVPVYNHALSADQYRTCRMLRALFARERGYKMAARGREGGRKAAAVEPDENQISVV